MKRLLLLLIFYMGMANSYAQLITGIKSANNFSLVGAAIYVDANDDALVKRSAELLQQDIEMVTGKKPPLINNIQAAGGTIIIIGSIEKSALLQQLIQQKKINIDTIKNKWEAYQVQGIYNPFANIGHALVIAGSDRRGTAYGVVELSRQIGVSPWYWWADVPVKKKTELYVNSNVLFTDSPKVKYRGIFINDEAPALSNWSKEKFGGFNHLFYAKVFELMLRLKSNYIWPAMWGHAFYDDDSVNIKTAEEYGIVIGTSHHEPLMKAHDEWRRYGTGKWNYDSNEVKLQAFWRSGMQRATNEKIVSIGMRGDGDEPMSRQTATALLERIVNDQRKIITEITRKPAEATPQLWALYKEVQDYYEKGMRVPDDVTLLLCDDNWGNLRKLPTLDEQPRRGGYGIYYHFDYVGGPRNYKWLNTNPLPRVWEQMHLAWEYNVKQIWIVNVGDIKPMELPISFFLDYAWNPEKIGPDDVQQYTVQWAADQFGEKYAKPIATILSKYAKYNGRKKPELLNANTYSLSNYNEAESVTKDYKDLVIAAEKIDKELSPEYRNAFFQLVLHPVKACANLQEMYTNIAKNEYAYANHLAGANSFAEKAKELYQKDSMISVEYHQLNDGKWNHMMDQTHIGYTYWQQPAFNKMPSLKYITDSAAFTPGSKKNISVKTVVPKPGIKYVLPKGRKANSFYEQDGYISIDASHFTDGKNSREITWKVLPDHGRTGDGVTTWPVTAAEQTPNPASPYLSYEVYPSSRGEFTISAYFSPTLNFHNSNTGLQYAISVDDEAPQIVSINKEGNNVGVWNKWMADNIIIKTTTHHINNPGKHIIRYWMVNSGVVLQKLVADFGGVKQSYLGPPETK
ncbi:MAG: glycosyl hydrolase 115 family protein [Ferruginibacter sp.]